MISKEWLCDAMIRDCRILVHLHYKTPVGLQEWRPTEGQRSILELFRYISVSPISYLRSYLEPAAGWREKYQAVSQALSFDDVPNRLIATAEEIEAFFRETSDETLATHRVKTPAGEELPFAQAILNGPVKWLPAYKMQVFLYLKQNGVNLSTPNLWRGVDPA
jgi:hypothetical protein